MGGFHFNPLKGITRALGIHDSARPGILTGLELLFPVVGIGNELAGKAFNLGGKLLTPKPAPIAHRPAPYFPSQGPGPAYNVTYGAPQYGGYGGGGGFDYTTPNYITPYGGSPWDFSMMYSQPLTQPYQASSGRPDRSWEDLTSLTEAVLPFFL